MRSVWIIIKKGYKSCVGGRYFITGKRLYVHNCILAADKPVSYMRAQAIRDGTGETDHTDG